MLITTTIVFGLCLVLAGGQCVVVAAFLWNMIRHRRPIASQTPQPKAAVVLALRGPDPFLDDCVERLLAQEYSDYTIFLIVDSPSDPVLKDIDRVLAKTAAKNVVVSTLENPHTTCSLKCSALIQAVGGLDESYQVVAFLDGDALPHPTWLLELVAPLANPKVGVSYGNRWYVPTSDSWGAWVRYCWNVGAVVQVWLNEIIWAGSMAMRTDTIERIDLLAAWSKALSVDATVHRQLKIHDYQVQFVPSVIMVNREAISLSPFIRWVQRQLIAAKSCGAGWRLVGLHAIILSGTQLLTLITLIVGWQMNEPLVVWLCAIGLALYWGSSVLAIAASEWTIRRTVLANGEAIQWPPLSAVTRLVPAMLLTQFAYPYALSGAIFRRQVAWRGVEYDIRGVGDVLMRNYHPYIDSQQSTVTESIV